MQNPDSSSLWLTDDGLPEALGKRTATGGALAMGAQVIRVILQIGSSAVLARLIRPADFGLFAMALTVSSFVTIFSELGLSTATVQARSLSQRTVSSLLHLSVVVAVVAMLLTILMSGAASYFYKDIRVFYLGSTLSLAVPLGAAASQHMALMGRRMMWFRINFISLFSQFLGVAIAILLAWLADLRYWALAFQIIMASAATVMLSWSMCSWRPSWIFDWNSCKAEIKFGLHMTGFSVTNYFHRQMDNVLIGWRWGAAELGFYSRSYNLLLLPLNFVSGAISQVIMPLLSRSQDNAIEWRRYFLTALSFSCFGSIGITVVLISNSDQIILFLLGPSWGYSAQIFYYLGLSTFGMAAMSPMGWVFMSLGRTDRWFRWGLITASVFPLAFLAGLPFHAIGVAKAYSLAVIVMAIPCIIYAMRDAPATALDVFAAIRAPIIAGISTILMVRLLVPAIAFIDAPLVCLLISCSVAAVIFCSSALLLLFIDPAQRQQRNVVTAIFRSRQEKKHPVT